MSMLYDFIEKYSKSKNTIFVMSVISFLESSFLPIPPDLILIPAIISNKKNALKYTLYCTIFSILGGILGYVIGYYMFDIIGSKIIEYYNYGESFKKFCSGFNEYAFFIIALKGLTPIPYKIVTIASGFSHVNFEIFLIASVIARSSRFLILMYLCKKFGPKVDSIIKNHTKTFLFLIIFGVVIGFILLAYL